jgi:SOS-response transcriptional repressor LexA
MKDLSPQQQRVYDEIAAFQQENGYTPTMRVLGEKMGISLWTVAVHINKLVEKERARRTSPRHIELT